MSFQPSQINGWNPEYSRFSSYEKHEEIGRGSYATVYRGFNFQTNEPVAIKVMSQNYLVGKNLIQNIESEIKFLSKLKHPNIVSLIDIERIDEKICLIMELCSIGDLADYIKKNKDQIGIKGHAGGLHEIVVRHFLKQIVASFKFLRKNNLVHRDLKPANILLSSPKEELFMTNKTEASNFSNSLPQLKIGDFGFIKFLPTQSMTSTVCGSPLYMAPEILKGEPYSASVDLWSIGVILYELITGTTPFHAKSPPDLVRAIERSNDVINFPGDNPRNNNATYGLSRPGQGLISDDLKDLIRCLLKQNPKDRISFEDFFNHSAVLRDIIEPVPSGLSRAVYDIRSKPNGRIRNLQDSSSTLKKSASLSVLKESKANETLVSTNRRDSFHPVTEVKTSSKINNSNLKEEDEDELIENDYVFLDDLENDELNNRDIQKRSNPVYITPSTNSIRKNQTNSLFNENNLDSSEPLPIGLLGKEMANMHISKGSSSGSRSNTGSQSNGSKTENGWSVGANAASTLAKALTLASNKLFGPKGLSPPSTQYSDRSYNPKFLPLHGPILSDEEKVVIQEMEQVACQAYSLVKFTDPKYKQILSNKKLSEVEKYNRLNQNGTSDVSFLAIESFLLYSKSLALINEAYERAKGYWRKIKDPKSGKQVKVSNRFHDTVNWLEDKSKECTKKLDDCQLLLDDLKLKITNYDTDAVIFDNAVEMCKDTSIRKLINDDDSEREKILKLGLWMLEAILFRTALEAPLSLSDETLIQSHINNIQEQLKEYRKKAK